MTLVLLTKTKESEEEDLLAVDDDEDDEKSSSKKKQQTEEEINAEVFGEGEGGYHPNTDIYAVPVTMTVSGDLDDLHNFINDIINSDNRILLVKYSWGEFRDIVSRDADGNIISSSNQGSGNVSNIASSEEGITADEIEDTIVEIIIRKSLTINLEIYMCDTSDVAASPDVETE